MGSQIWLAADYHFPSAYSIRVPGSSMSSTQAMPAPGPATVRLALIKSGIELFGEELTQASLFPTIRSMPVLIQPPEKVAFSDQVYRAYKGSDSKTGQTLLRESIVYRQTACATGNMTIYCKTDQKIADVFSELFYAVGYWGQGNSFATCIGVERRSPLAGYYAVPQAEILSSDICSKHPFFRCFCTEFRECTISWKDVQGADDAKNREPMKVQVFVWPMIICEQHGGNLLLQRRSLKEYRAPPDIGPKNFFSENYGIGMAVKKKRNSVSDLKRALSNS